MKRRKGGGWDLIWGMGCVWGYVWSMCVVCMGYGVWGMLVYIGVCWGMHGAVKKSRDHKSRGGGEVAQIFMSLSSSLVNNN